MPHLDNIGAIAGGDIKQGQVMFSCKTKAPAGHLHEVKIQKGVQQAPVTLFCCSADSAEQGKSASAQPEPQRGHRGSAHDQLHEHSNALWYCSTSGTAAHQPGAHTHVHINLVGQHQDWDAGAELAQLVIPPAGNAASCLLGASTDWGKLLMKAPPTGTSDGSVLAGKC